MSGNFDTGVRQRGHEHWPFFTEAISNLKCTTVRNKGCHISPSLTSQGSQPNT